MENDHHYKVIEIYDDGIKLLECPTCGASMLFRNHPLYYKALDYGNGNVAHSFFEGGGPGISLGIEARAE